MSPHSSSWMWIPLALAVAACGGEAEPVVDVVTPACQTDDDCGDGEVCWVNPVAQWSACVEGCRTDDDCTGGQQCREMFDALACVDPLPAEPARPPEVDDSGLPLTPGDVQCVGPVDGIVEIPFTLDAATTSAMVVPFTTDGGPIRPVSWALPDGDLVFDGGRAGFLGVTSSLLGVTAPLFVPQAPFLSPLLEPGQHVYRVDATSEELCAYVVREDAQTGRTLDVNVVFVGLDGLDAASAPADADLEVALDTLSDIYGAAGITLGEVRFADAAPQVADDFALIDDRADIDALMATSTAPGRSDDALLSVNLFVVAAIDLENSGAIGISQGLPGPAGLHGTSGSGVVLTGEFLPLGTRDNPQLGAELTGVVMAHEIGHWLGLFHTSELAGGVQDPLDDTPGCDDIADRVDSGDLGGCPDRLNLMFPVADAAAREVTGEQGAVLIANPVTR